jgi:hypothetical protein
MTASAGKMTQAEHLALLKQAVVANIEARIEHDKREEAKQRPPGTTIKAHTLGDDWDRLRLESLIRDPVRHALRKQLKKLGKQIYAVNGIAAMHDIIEDVSVSAAKAHGVNYSWVGAVISKAWNGVGGWCD